MGQFEDVAGLFAEIPFEELITTVMTVSDTIEKAMAKAVTEGGVKAMLEFDDLIKAVIDILPHIRDKRTGTNILAVLLKIDPDEAKVLPFTTGAEVVRDFFILNAISPKRFLSFLRSVPGLPNQTT